jgi:hypothetical protein
MLLVYTEAEAISMIIYLLYEQNKLPPPPHPPPREATQTDNINRKHLQNIT